MPKWTLLLLLATACTACEPDSDPPLDDSDEPHETDTPGPSEECEQIEVGPSSGILSLAVELTDIPTVVRVSWQTAAPSAGRVEYGDSEVYDRATPELAAATSQSVLVRGLCQQQDLHLRVVTAADDHEICTSDQQISTGSLEPTLPWIALSEHDPAQAAGGFTIAPLITGATDLVVILDDEGEYVWAYPVSANYRARLAQGGDSLLVNVGATGPDDQAKILRIGFDGSRMSETLVQGGHTDFVQVGPTTFGSIAWIVCADGQEPVDLGMAIVEVEEEGAERLIWSDFDVIPPSATCELVSGREWPGSAMEDTSSALNGLSYDPEADAYYATARSWNGVLMVDRPTGQTAWVVTSDHRVEQRIEPPMDLLAAPHSVERVGDTFLVLNEGWPGGPVYANVLELAVDATAGTAEEAWSWSPDELESIDMLGNAQRLWNGGTLAVWATAGRMDEAGPAGDTVWRVDAAMGTRIGFAERVQDLY